MSRDGLVLENAAGRLADSIAAAPDTPGLTRFEVPIADTDPLSWLAAQPGDIKLYWSDRGSSHRVAAIGAVESFDAPQGTPWISAVEAAAAIARTAHPDVRVFGGARFDAERPFENNWEQFSCARFWTPAVELLRRDSESLLACNVRLEQRELTLAALEEVSLDTFAGDGQLNTSVQRFDEPDAAGWTAMVEDALRNIRDDAMRKVVLARTSTWKFEGGMDPWALLAALEAVTPGSFHYAFQTAPGTVFLGASPERLYRRSGSTLESEAVAGTRPRGTTPDEDAGLAEELRASAKELHEHRYVSEQIRGVFERLCREVSTGPMERMMLPHCQHLLIRFHGVLRDTNDAVILQSMHPTPAVGGVPADAAAAFIRTHEPFDRGWYTGPVGWISRDAAEFAVAIRSALVENNHLTVYAGAGIVDGSDPAREWEELDSKTADFRQLLS